MTLAVAVEDPRQVEVERGREGDHGIHRLDAIGADAAQADERHEVAARAAAEEGDRLGVDAVLGRDRGVLRPRDRGGHVVGGGRVRVRGGEAVVDRDADEARAREPLADRAPGRVRLVSAGPAAAVDGEHRGPHPVARRAAGRAVVGRTAHVDGHAVARAERRDRDVFHDLRLRLCRQREDRALGSGGGDGLLTRGLLRGRAAPREEPDRERADGRRGDHRAHGGGGQGSGWHSGHQGKRWAAWA